MNIRSKNSPRRLAVAIAALLAALPWGVHAQQELTVPLSDPRRPATIDVSLFNGNITIKAYEGNEVRIVVGDDDDDEDENDRDFDFDSDDDDERARREGLRRIPNTGMGLIAEERDNRVTIGRQGPPSDLELEISVPRMTSVHAKTVNDDLIIEGVTGEHELTNMNGEIFASDIRGSMVASTTNGDIEVSMTEVTPNKAMSFSSFNGDIHVVLPANLSADFRISGGRGDVYTNFDFEERPLTSVVEDGGDRGRRVTFNREMSAIVGGGGPEVRFKTFNGDITIRKR
jgi:Putative adhesin